MSKIGRKPVIIPQGVDVKIEDRLIKVKGPKGELEWAHPDTIKVSAAEGKVVVERLSDLKPDREKHGLTRSLVQNMVIGVSDGYKRVMEIVGVGYRAAVDKDRIVFSLGFSHPIDFALPGGIKAEVDKKQVVLTLSGIDKQKIGQVAADIMALRPPDAYKGKGIRYSGTVMKLKAGKAGKK